MLSARHRFKTEKNISTFAKGRHCFQNTERMYHCIIMHIFKKTKTKTKTKIKHNKTQ